MRSADEGTSLVEALDPDAMMSLSDGVGVRRVAIDAQQRLSAVLQSLQSPNRTQKG